MSDKRSKWLAVPGLAALAAAAVLLSAAQGASSNGASRATPQPGGWAYSGASTPQGRSPEQPIDFPHPVHVKTLGMNCLYCHSSANEASDPGMPAVATCMGCHLVVGPDRPARGDQPARRSEAIAALQDFWNRGAPIPWVRIHKVPDYVQFPHMRHVTAGVACQSCHGDVQNMERVYQAASLNMGWCINCHVNGYTPPDAPPEGLPNVPTAQAVAQVPQQGTGAGVHVGEYAYPRRARYDCTNCHY